MALIDWYSRYVLAFEVSTTMDHQFCLSALRRALERSKPEIHNSDQGAQFTCEEYVNGLIRLGIRVSTDGKGRALDNVFVERLWRTVKYEDAYIRDYHSPRDSVIGFTDYFRLYNCDRPHSALGGRTAEEVHFGG